MSGVTNTGLVNYISNDVPVFPSNSVTVDIFGNAFYRGYEFAASDDVGVLWNEDVHFNSYHLIYIVASISRSLMGIYDYGHKLRASRLGSHEIFLPATVDGQLNLIFMEDFIRAQQKITIKNISLVHRRYIDTTKRVIVAH